MRRHRQKRNRKTLADLRTLKPGESQMVPFDLWDAYARRDGLTVTGQAWDIKHHCPIVFAERKERPIERTVTPPTG